MTASERIREIEGILANDLGPPPFGDVVWLLERVKTLEKRNERLTKGLEVIRDSKTSSSEFARATLAEDEGAER